MDKSSLSSVIGSRIGDFRRKRKLSQEKLANQLEVSRTSIVNIEKGRHTPSLVLVYKIASVLRIEVSELLPSLNEIKKESNTFNIDFSGLNKEQKNSVVELIQEFKKLENEKKVAGN